MADLAAEVAIPYLHSEEASMVLKKIGLMAILVLLVALFFFFDLGRYLTLASLKENRDALVSLYERHHIFFIATFITLYIVQTALSLPGATILSLGAGAVFGVGIATIVVNIGATIGAFLAFLTARYLFRDAIQNKFGPRLEKMNAELEARGLNYLLFLRLVPLFPFFLINLGSGLTKMPARTFVLGTMLGIIPGSIVFCNAGASLASINSLSEIASFRVLGSFGLLGLFALVPALYQKLKTKPRK
jgi:uncharacterized membrane protein YdjX (TVP38/TMEM64 family)